MTNQPLQCFECGFLIKPEEEPYIYDPDIHIYDPTGDGEPLAAFHLNCWVTPNDEELRETASRLSLLLDLAAHGMRNLVEGYDPECADVVMTDLQESWQRLQDVRDRLAKHAGREQKTAYTISVGEIKSLYKAAMDEAREDEAEFVVLAAPLTLTRSTSSTKKTEATNG